MSFPNFYACTNMVESQKQNMGKRPRKKKTTETNQFLLSSNEKKNVILKKAYLLCKTTKESNSYL